MGRPARFIPENRNGVLVEVTCRVIGARALLVPSPDPVRFNEVVTGVIGRALEVSPRELCSMVWTANHWHGLCVVRNQQQLSRFMHHVQCNISKEVGTRLRSWREAFWERRYDGIVVSHEPEAQWQRLKYHLSHGVKEGFVESPLDWPGIHAAKALVHGEPLEGYWWNRRKEWSAMNRGLVGHYDFATRYLVHFSPLPAFRHLSPEVYQDKVAELIHEIEEEGTRKRDGNPVAGREKVLSQNPYEPPTRRTQRSTKPMFHVVSKQARNDLRQGLAEFLSQYYEASVAMRGGDLTAATWFPEGCYPSALSFVGPSVPAPPLPPPTRLITTLDSGGIERGEIPVVENPAVYGNVGTLESRTRGQPP